MRRRRDDLEPHRRAHVFARHIAVASAKATTPAAVREKHEPGRPLRHTERSLQRHTVGGERHVALYAIAAMGKHRVGHGSAQAARARARSSKSCTSWSVVWEKSSYQRPTAWNGSGVMTHTISSAMSPNESHVSAADTGTATMI